ncbi:hypothetical protein EVAR_51175_1 [Eumeta japonica]|uniref:Uncharacterized protein n=1 Tax=Eumeta variegata TaxID=151549 RepID=A0A4C1XCX1_EUMVA|nr:hypothetical protein EVAR_51175_1 [Eumeta japonica]
MACDSSTKLIDVTIRSGYSWWKRKGAATSSTPLFFLDTLLRFSTFPNHTSCFMLGGQIKPLVPDHRGLVIKGQALISEIIRLRKDKSAGPARAGRRDRVIVRRSHDARRRRNYYLSMKNWLRNLLCHCGRKAAILPPCASRFNWICSEIRDEFNLEVCFAFESSRRSAKILRLPRIDSRAVET